MMRTCKTSWGPTGGSVALPPRAARSHNQHRVVVRAAAEDTKTVAELIEEQGIDMTISGLRHLPEETQHRYAQLARSHARDWFPSRSKRPTCRILTGKVNPFEKKKVKKGGDMMWTEVEELAVLLRNGDVKWEDLDLDDVDVRMKWAGLFHRGKRTPGKFMQRLKVSQGVLSSEQLRALGSIIAPYGEDGCADITTRANIQLRGIEMDKADKSMETLRAVGLSSLMSGMDNIRNITGSPIAGIDPEELIDSRPLCQSLQDHITNYGKGNAALTNLPRKINVGISTSRDDFAHCHINDVGLKAVVHPDSGEVGFNVELGGYFSIKRNTMSIPGDTYIRPDQINDYVRSLMEVFRDLGERNDRQKARLMWLVEAVGVKEFRKLVAQRMGLEDLPGDAHVSYPDAFARRDILGIHKQKQEGKYWVGACIPAGRMFAKDFDDLAAVADKYGDGSVRVTVEQNVVIPNVDEADLEALQKEEIFQRFEIFPGNIMSGLVSCTGSQFCGFALVETKNKAMEITRKLEEQLEIPSLVRMHWTGCPNSCGQAQVGDIGLMGAPAKKDGKGVEGVRIFLGGAIGENPALATEFEKAVPATEEDLLPALKKLLVERFGAVEK